MDALANSIKENATSIIKIARYIFFGVGGVAVFVLLIWAVWNFMKGDGKAGLWKLLWAFVVGLIVYGGIKLVQAVVSYFAPTGSGFSYEGNTIGNISMYVNDGARQVVEHVNTLA